SETTGRLVVTAGPNGVIETIPGGDDVWDAAVPAAQRHCYGTVGANTIIIRDPPGGDGAITPAKNCCDDAPGANGSVVDGGDGVITSDRNVNKLPRDVLAVTAS